MASPIRANASVFPSFTSVFPSFCRACSHSRCQVTRAPTRSAACSGSRLRPAAASIRPISWNIRAVGSQGEGTSAIRAANWRTASLATWCTTLACVPSSPRPYSGTSRRMAAVMSSARESRSGRIQLAVSRTVSGGTGGHSAATTPTCRTIRMLLAGNAYVTGVPRNARVPAACRETPACQRRAA
jgi:hypothetical protein